MANLPHILIKCKTSCLMNLISKPHPLLSAVSSKPLTGLKRQFLSMLLNIVHYSIIHSKVDRMSWGKVQSTSTLNDWAGYVDKINR